VGVPARVLLDNRLLDETQQLLLELEQLFGRIRAHVDSHPRLRSDRIHRGATANGTDSEGGPRLRRRLQLRYLGNRPAHGVDSAGQAELLEGMATGTLEDHLVTMAAGGLVDDAGDAKPVYRNKSVNVLVIPEQRLDAAEIAELFLADGADDQEIANRCDPAL